MTVPRFQPRRFRLAPFTVAIVACSTGVLSAAEPVTFYQDVAPIIREHCTPCHRPGQAGPFDLVTEEDAKRRARQIAEVVADGYMPPWLPDAGVNRFVGERVLSAGEKKLIADWVAGGAPAGEPVELPPLPPISEWLLGEPDLVLELDSRFQLPPDGRDVYRNFVYTNSLSTNRHVIGAEIQPDNYRILHHAFVKVDDTGVAKRLDAENSAPGYPGMVAPTEIRTPVGHLLGWQPGRQPRLLDPRMSWTLRTNETVVLEAHLNPSGKPETIAPRIGLHFTDRPAEIRGLMVGLLSFTMDIPPGETNHVVTSEFEVPVDSEVQAVLPHAHYLARTMHGKARFPDGTERWLIKIDRWDFNWQSDYVYEEPVKLPKGTKLLMRFTYDNSADNPANPHHPPRRVGYGPETTDEMAELWFRLVPDDQGEFSTLEAAYKSHLTRALIPLHEHEIRQAGATARTHHEFGVTLLATGDVGRAEEQFDVALRLDPGFSASHYMKGLIRRQQNRLPEAALHFDQATRLDPENAKAFGNAGIVYFQLKQYEPAAARLTRALELNPVDALASDTLGMCRYYQGRYADAAKHFEQAIRLQPDHPLYREHLQAAREMAARARP